MTKQQRRVAIARQVIRRELGLYDRLASKPRIRVEPARPNRWDIDEVERPYHCAHGLYLHEPCDSCCRSEADCIPYKRQFESKLRELLSALE